MVSNRRRTSSSVTLAILGLAAAMLIAAACGGDDDSDDTAAAEGRIAPTEYVPIEDPPLSVEEGIAEAERLVEEQQRAPVDARPPTEPVDASKAEGKRLMVVPILGTLPIAQITNEALEEALDLVGAELTEVDGQGDVSTWTSAIQQATTQGFDALALEAIQTEVVQAPLREAADQGVRIVQAFEWAESGLPPEETREVGVEAHVSFSQMEMAKQMANYTVADSGGEANVVIITASDSPTGVVIGEAVEDQLRYLCPNCEIDVADSPQGLPPERLETLTRTLLRDDPTIDYMLPVFDAMALTMVPAIHDVGAANRVKIVSQNGTPAVLELIKRQDVVVADVGANIPWSGWAIADEFFRLMADDPPVDDENVPLRLFSVENIDEIDLEADQSTWFGPDEWKEQYREIWGLG